MNAVLEEQTSQKNQRRSRGALTRESKAKGGGRHKRAKEPTVLARGARGGAKFECLEEANPLVSFTVGGSSSSSSSSSERRGTSMQPQQ